MKLQTKSLLGSFMLVVLPVVPLGTVVSVLATQKAEEALVDQTRDQLTTISEVKRAQIQDYFSLVEDQVQASSIDPDMVAAMEDFRAAYFGTEFDVTQDMRNSLQSFYTGEFVPEMRRRGGESTDIEFYAEDLPATSLALQYHYIVANDNPYDFKYEMDVAEEDGSAYSAVHAVHHPRVRNLVQSVARTSAFQDVLFVDADSGQVVYSMAKKLDFATSLDDGPFSRTALGEAFRRALEVNSPDDVVFSDFQPYLPAYGEPAGFFASPVFNGEERIGVLVFQSAPTRINTIMKSGESWSQMGLGETGESYLVGGDGTLRSDSRFLIESANEYLQALRNVGVDQNTVSRIQTGNTGLLLQPVRTASADTALAGLAGFMRDTDYRGEQVLSAYSHLPVLGIDWAIISQLDEAEALEPVADMRWTVIATTVAVVLALLLLGAAAAREFTRELLRPIQHLESTVRRIAGGDDTARARMDTKDEMQTLGDAFDSLLDERIAQYEQAAAENDRLNDSIIELLRAVSQLSQHDLTVKVPVTEDITGPVADALNEMVSEISQLLNDASSVAEGVGAASDRLKEQADAVRQMAEEEGIEVDSMAAELDAAARTMAEIAEVAQRCDRIAAETSETTGTALTTVTGTVQGMSVIRELVHETEKRIKRLGERSQEISGIVDIINTIAERTHVLALNAAMQAAAAGEAGRGFAVVADEVQRLAESSRNATSQISGLVHNIQVETSDTISTMGRTISEVVEGSRQAERAGQQMQRTQASTNELVAAVQEIARGSQQQSSTSLELQKKAGIVQLSTRNTRDKLEEQTTQTRVLVTSSGQLIESIRAFKLPERESKDGTQPVTAGGDYGSGTGA